MTFRLKLPRWSDVLVEIHKRQPRICYSEKLNKSIKGSLTYLREVIKALENQKLIEIIPTSNIKRIILTDTGVLVSGSIQQILEQLKNAY